MKHGEEEVDERKMCVYRKYKEGLCHCAAIGKDNASSRLGRQASWGKGGRVYQSKRLADAIDSIGDVYYRSVNMCVCVCV